MGELQRAILDKNSTYSASAFYNVLISNQVTNTGAPTLARRQGSLQCKTDTWFLVQAALLTGFGITAGQPSSPFSKSGPSTFQIQRAGNQQVFSSSPQIKANQNYNLNNLVTMDEYILFKPAELIVFIGDVLVTDSAPYFAINYLTLVGVEYKMPAGKGTQTYGH